MLDEATSSLDSESEALIQDGLRSLRRGRTTFVIAHRLSTIRSADQILVLEHGEIVERGTHAELLALGGRYRTLYDKQYNFEIDRFINPGEDFTPEPEKPATAPAAIGRRAVIYARLPTCQESTNLGCIRSARPRRDDRGSRSTPVLQEGSEVRRILDVALNTDRRRRTPELRVKLLSASVDR